MDKGLLFFMQLLASGIALGCLYAMIALGFVLILKATDILNFAQGEVIMMAAFICYFLVTALHLPFLLAVLLTCLSVGLMGIVTERVILRPMIGEPVFAVVMVILSQTQIWIMISTLGLIVIFFLFFKYSRIGLAMRGTADDQHIALLMGISVKRVFALIWGISFITGAIAGIFLANVMVINLGISFVAVSAFPAIILGGLESIPGAIIGGIAIGVIENLAGGYLDQIIGGGVKDVTPFVVLFLILMVRPYGLFGKKEIERV